MLRTKIALKMSAVSCLALAVLSAAPTAQALEGCLADGYSEARSLGGGIFETVGGMLVGGAAGNAISSGKDSGTLIGAGVGTVLGAVLHVNSRDRRENDIRVAAAIIRQAHAIPASELEDLTLEVKKRVRREMRHLVTVQWVARLVVEGDQSREFCKRPDELAGTRRMRDYVKSRIEAGSVVPDAAIATRSTSHDEDTNDIASNEKSSLTLSGENSQAGL